MSKFKIPTPKELLDAGVHLGHQSKSWHPRMESYIYATRKGIHVIDLEKTQKALEKAANFLYEIAKDGGQVIFVGSKRQASEVIAQEAIRSGALYVNERWLGGTLTNSTVIKKNIKKLLDLKKRKESGQLLMYTKKEQLLLDREIQKLENSVGGILALKGIPKAIFVVDIKREKTAVTEAKKMGVAVVGIVDTNSDPSLVDIAIPGNDDALRSILAITKVIADAIEKGYKEFDNKSNEVANKHSEEKEIDVKIEIDASIDPDAAVEVEPVAQVLKENNDSEYTESLKEPKKLKTKTSSPKAKKGK